MDGTLAFGTAGLRGPVRAGSNGMNTAVVTRTTAGVADWLRSRGDGGGTVFVGRDARHGSEAFAATAAGVLAAAGFDAALLAEPLPTPVLAYATRVLGAVAGIQVTASHNPPADNGYKLYLRGGSQLVPPADREIESTIAGQPAAASIAACGSPRDPGSDVLERYLNSAAAVARGDARDLRIALTPMHVVGGPACVEALRRAGFTDVHVVPEQAEPDPDFPTVAFPNPEEPGAADKLLNLAESVGADLAIALDPDADRCGIGMREPGGWRMWRGDETGAVLGDYVLRTTTAADPLVATTIVSSSLLGKIAARRGARYDETLTGFKWLVRSGDGNGTGLVYAYEEALGHCVGPDTVRDKDGISAAVLADDLAATVKRDGQSLPELRERLYAEHGVHLTDQVSLRFADTYRIAAVMRTMRAGPPQTLAGAPVRAEDLLPGTDALRLVGEGVRVVVRPSGTESKLKSYLEVVEPPDACVEPATGRARARLRGLREDVTAVLSREE
jgi:phosphomannomutase